MLLWGWQLRSESDAYSLLLLRLWWCWWVDQVVLLLVQHDASGSVGLILNR